MKNFINRFNPFTNNLDMFKFKSDGATLGANETYNEYCDTVYNKTHPGNFEQIDKFNNWVTDSLYFVDNFTKIPYGHISATLGRGYRDNYELNYERSPFNDNFERSFDAFKKATEYDY